MLATPRTPGAIAIIQLLGDGLPLLSELTGIADWPMGRTRLVRFADIDEGIAVRLTDSVAQLMPHGGPRIVQRLVERLMVLGAEPIRVESADPQDQYPEAADRIESLMLAALARAQSPAAIELLLDQPRRWRANPNLTDEDRARSRRLNRLIDPPIVVLAGPANIGKSTLSNALLGRAMSITMDMPGTTRDYVAGRIDLGGVVVDWHDTPGVRDSSDPIERKAIELAGRMMMQADLLIAMTAPGEDWPTLPREPDLRVMNKCDLVHERSVTPGLRVSALTGEGLPALVAAVRERLVPPADIDDPGAWLFDERLES